MDEYGDRIYINEEQAEEVAKLLLTEKYTHRQIAEMLGIRMSMVHSIALGNTWRRVYEKYELWRVSRKRSNF